MMKRGRAYSDKQYAESLREWGEPHYLPNAQGWILKRSIGDTGFQDAMGCYPLYSCTEWAGLPEDVLAQQQMLVSLVLVTDPFGHINETILAPMDPEAFFHFKNHYIVNLDGELDRGISSHHRYYARRVLRRFNVMKIENPELIKADWLKLYAQLIARHGINGIAAFSPEAFRAQLAMDSMQIFAAYDGKQVLGIQLWMDDGQYVYHHLGAYAEAGYKHGVSYGLLWFALHWFQDQNRVAADLGGGAGTQRKNDGLTAFKKGWTARTEPVFLVGKILNPAIYEKLTGSVSATDSYFPAYRAGEFS